MFVYLFRICIFLNGQFSKLWFVLAQGPEKGTVSSAIRVRPLLTPPKLSTATFRLVTASFARKDLQATTLSVHGLQMRVEHKAHVLLRKFLLQKETDVRLYMYLYIYIYTVFMCIYMCCCCFFFQSWGGLLLQGLAQCAAARRSCAALDARPHGSDLSLISPRRMSPWDVPPLY